MSETVQTGDSSRGCKVMSAVSRVIELQCYGSTGTGKNPFQLRNQR